MKQVLYTSCEAGKSLNGAGGFQVRGVSAGIGPESIHAALRHMAYELPPFIHPSQLAPTASPVRLAFLRTPELGPVLGHSVYAGEDPTTRRPGNFFSHLLLDMPPAFTPAAAIRTWGSDSWCRADGPFAAALPDVDEVHAGQVLTDDTLRQFLASDHGQKMFRFVLAAMLTTEPDWRIFLVGPSQDVAMCVYGLTRVLPEACQRALTFSTYESQPLACSGRVVGTWTGDSGETDMPPSCYLGRAVGYNAYTGRASQVAAEGEFVDYAITAAVTGDRNGLDNLRAVCDHCQIDRPSLLNLVCHAERAGELSNDDLRQLAPFPRFLSHLLNKPSIQRPLLDRFAGDQELTGVLATKVVPILREAPDSIAAFQDIAKRAAIHAILGGESPRAQSLLEHILPAASDAPAASVYLAVLTEIIDPRAVPWQTRAYLITRMAEVLSNGQQATMQARWLAASPAELPLLSDLAIPAGWKTHACLTCLRDTGVTRSLVETLTSHPDLLRDVLRRLPGSGEAAAKLPSLIAAILANSRAPAQLVGDMVRARRQYSPEVTSAFLAAAARNGSIDVLSLASHGGPGLLEVLNEGDNRNTFLVQLLDCSPERLLNDSQVLALFRAAVGNMDRGEIRDGLESILAIRSFLDRPVLGEETLARVSMGLKVFQSSAIRKLVLRAALEAMFGQEDSTRIGRIPESLVRNLGPCLSDGPNALYRWLLEQSRVRKDFWRRQHLICALIAVGLGATSTGLSRHTVAMAEQARDLAEEVARRSKTRVFTFIERESRNWPDEARVRWNLFAKFIRPRRFIDRFARPWKEMATVPLMALCLIAVASRMGCRNGTIGTGFANEEVPTRQSHETRDPLVERTAHDRPHP